MELYCKTIKGKPGWRELTRDFAYKDADVPAEFQWNGSNPESLTEGNAIKRWFGRVINNLVPRFNGTLKSSCVHDYMCKLAESYGMTKRAKYIRRKGDNYYKELSEMSKLNTAIGYGGVRLGGYFKYWRVK